MTRTGCNSLIRVIGRRSGVLLALAVLVFGLSGCAVLNGPFLNPGGPIGSAERDLFYFAGGVMLIVLVAVYSLAAVVLWRYRASHPRGAYQPDWNDTPALSALVWGGPSIIILILGFNVWTQTHRLDPYTAVSGDKPPVHIQAIALNWKWLFIYPDQNIAAVNEIAFPVGAPVSISITSDTVMNDFMVQGLSSQIFAMAGMTSHMNFRADREGIYIGRNMQFSGSGFSPQRFAAKAMSEGDYQAWLKTAKDSPLALDAVAYRDLAKPSVRYPTVFYSSGAQGLFNRILAKYPASDAEQKCVPSSPNQ